MCMMVNRLRPTIAKKDRFFWKVVARATRETDYSTRPPTKIYAEDRCLAYYMSFLYKFHQKYRVKITTEKTSFYAAARGFRWKVERGFHMYLTEEDAIRKAGTNKEAFVVKCRVPAGSTIIHGVWGDDYITPQVVSNCVSIYKPKNFPNR